MLKKYVSKVVRCATFPIRQIIKDIIIDIIHDERAKTLYDNLKLTEYAKSSKLTIYDAMLNMNIIEISLIVEYIDPKVHAKQTSRYEHKTIPEFNYFLENFTPAHNYFTSVFIVVYYEHEFGKQHVNEYPVSSIGDKVYSCGDLKEKIIQPMLTWLRKHPELLI